MEIVGKFKLNNIIYGIGVKNNKYFTGRIKDGKLYTFLTEEEKNIINLILDQLTPGRDIVEVTPVTIKDNTYKTYYNVSKNIFLFNPVPNERDLKFLNSTYNNQNEYLFNNNFVQTNNYFKRLVKLGKKTIVVLLSSAFLLSNAQVVKADTNVNQINENKLVNVVDDTLNYDISGDELDDNLVNEYINDELSKLDVNSLTRVDVQDLVTNAIYGNANLSEEEKKLVLKYSTVVLDNYKYMDLSRVLNSLNKLTIVYNPFSYTNPVLQAGVAGMCNLYENKIDFYHVENLEQVVESVFAHEVCHLFQNLNGEYTSFFIEGTNSLTVNEYCCEDTSYSDNKNIIGFLGEIIDKDLIKQYYFAGNLNGIRNALYEIVPDYTLVERFISLTRQFDETSIRGNNRKILMAQMKNILATFYEAKYNRKIEDDLVALYYYNEKSFIKKIAPDDITQYSDYYIKEKKQPNIINKTENDDKYDFTVIYNKIDHYDAIDRETAIEQGIIVHENGEDILPFAGYVDPLTNKVVMPSTSVSSKKLELDNTNRYVNSDLTR